MTHFEVCASFYLILPLIPRAPKKHDQNGQLYGINNEKNTSMYKKYAAMAHEESGVIFGGRLAEYKYYDMHQVIGSALVKAKRELEKIKRN